MSKNVKQIILVKYTEAVLKIYIYIKDESNVEIVDYYESPNIKDQNTSYLTSVILQDDVQNMGIKNNLDSSRRIYY